MTVKDRAIVAHWHGLLRARLALQKAAQLRLAAAERGLAWARRNGRHPRDWRVTLVAHEQATLDLRKRQVREARRVIARHSQTPGRVVKTSARGLALIASFEGERLAAYRDAVGVWTIGFGHTRGVHPGQRITHKLALAYLAADVSSCESAVIALGRKLSQGQFDALVSLCFNLGVGIIGAGHTLGDDLRAGNMGAAANAILMYDHAGGQRLAGLTRRRQAERSLFLS